MLALFILVWLFLTLFSVFGGIGIEEIYPGALDNDYTFLILIVNFYLSNFLGSFIGSIVSLGKLNRLLILIGTAILLLIFEVTFTYYLFEEIVKVKWGFWSTSFFLLILIMVLAFGGVRQILLLLLNSFQNGLINFTDVLQENIIDSPHNKVRKQNTSLPNTRATKTVIKRDKPKNINLNDDLYKY
ncbi:hypothetical protein [Flavobacterium sp. W22_SRS_FP1]|uniref:hypothetical protein n=1 Tax=Flavobacterium sp. W22_SRS_FP1 TaxID=3240276 RepID=UPI003F917A5E